MRKMKKRTLSLSFKIALALSLTTTLVYADEEEPIFGSRDFCESLVEDSCPNIRLPLSDRLRAKWNAPGMVQVRLWTGRTYRYVLKPTAEGLAYYYAFKPRTKSVIE